VFPEHIDVEFERESLRMIKPIVARFVSRSANRYLVFNVFGWLAEAARG
jgi:hypothetical protein